MNISGEWDGADVEDLRSLYEMGPNEIYVNLDKGDFSAMKDLLQEIYEDNYTYLEVRFNDED